MTQSDTYNHWHQSFSKWRESLTAICRFNDSHCFRMWTETETWFNEIDMQPIYQQLQRFAFIDSRVSQISCDQILFFVCAQSSWKIKFWIRFRTYSPNISPLFAKYFPFVCQIFSLCLPYICHKIYQTRFAKKFQTFDTSVYRLMCRLWDYFVMWANAYWSEDINIYLACNFPWQWQNTCVSLATDIVLLPTFVFVFFLFVFLYFVFWFVL